MAILRKWGPGGTQAPAIQAKTGIRACIIILQGYSVCTLHNAALIEAFKLLYACTVAHSVMEADSRWL